MRSLLLVPMFAVVLVLGCSSKEDIRAESAGATGTGGHRMQGAGGGPSSAAATTGAGGSGAGSCCSEPVHVAGHVKTITADTDMAQLVSGTAMARAKLADGPFVLTDAHANPITLAIVAGSDCSVPTTQIVVESQSNMDQDAHGMRVFVPAGSALCEDAGAFVTFSGFRPY